MKGRAAIWRLAITGGIAVILFILVANVITQPVAGDLRSYIAEFTDASGLHQDADVRFRGVRVGKVDAIDLKRRNGQSVAAVMFTLDKRYGIVSATRLAIKFQSLTGLRYVEVVNPSDKYSTADLMTHVPTTMTQPSLDVTALFNGLQPVFATMSPEDIDTFAANAVNYLSGDGSGLKPLLASVRKLTEFVSDRQQVIATLMRNLSELAGPMSGHSQDLVQILKWVNIPLDGALNAMDEFRKMQLYGGDFWRPVVRLVENLGFPNHPMEGWSFLDPKFRRPEWNEQNLDQGLDRAFTRIDDFIDAVKLAPVFQDNVPPPQDGAPAPCSHGRAQLPEQMDVLLNGQRVVLCNR